MKIHVRKVFNTWENTSPTNLVIYWFKIKSNNRKMIRITRLDGANKIYLCNQMDLYISYYKLNYLVQRKSENKFSLSKNLARKWKIKALQMSGQQASLQLHERYEFQRELLIYRRKEKKKIVNFINKNPQIKWLRRVLVLGL